MTLRDWFAIARAHAQRQEGQTMAEYGVVLALTKNPKTPLAMSMQLMMRLTTKDLAKLSVDRNVPEALRISSRKKVVANQAGTD